MDKLYYRIAIYDENGNFDHYAKALNYPSGERFFQSDDGNLLMVDNVGDVWEIFVDCNKQVSWVQRHDMKIELGFDYDGTILYEWDIFQPEMNGEKGEICTCGNIYQNVINDNIRSYYIDKMHVKVSVIGNAHYNETTKDDIIE